MSLRLFDSADRELRDFVPVTPGKVGIYICGLTTQAPPHIGHVRFAVAFDVLRRWLVRGHGYAVSLVRNVTDIDDKILAKAAASGEDWFALSYRNERLTSAALEALGVLPATYEPRATGHVPEMIELMRVLIEKGHAYPAPDGSADVYFDVRSWPSYGELTHQRLEDMAAAEDADPRGKHDPRDFALWKGSKPGEPTSATWPTPYGLGRPGWHLECSAMSGRYLGAEFDIHGGGIDLRFPHHENEQAQSHAAGRAFARYWMHNAWVTIEGEKMSKSLGNSLTVENIVKDVPPVVLRFALGTVHYRSTVAYSPSTLAEASAVWERLSGFVERSVAAVGEVSMEDIAALAPADFPEDFTEAMDDDLNVSAALAAIHEAVTEGNNALADRDDPAIVESQRLVRAMLDVLGLDPLAAPWRDAANGGDTYDALDVLVKSVLDERAAARAAKDWARADALRDTLTAAGIVVEDSADGARWHVEGRE